MVLSSNENKMKLLVILCLINVVLSDYKFTEESKLIKTLKFTWLLQLQLKDLCLIRNMNKKM